MYNNRYIFLVHFFICVIVVGISFYYNIIQDITLCPLCFLQIACYYLIAVISLIRFIIYPDKVLHYLYAIILWIFSFLGIVFSSRQLWMEHLSNSRSLPCSPGVSTFFLHSGAGHAMNNFFKNYQNCALVNWRFLDLSMPTWSLICFVVLIISASLLLLFYSNKREMDNYTQSV